MTPTNLAELPDVLVDVWGQHWRKSTPDGTEWSQPCPPGAKPHRLPFAVVAKRGPMTGLDDPDRVLVQKPADDLTAAEEWAREHEDETGHRTYRETSWSTGTGYVLCAGHGLDRCQDTFRYRNTRDRAEGDA